MTVARRCPACGHQSAVDARHIHADRAPVRRSYVCDRCGARRTTIEFELAPGAAHRVKRLAAKAALLRECIDALFPEFSNFREAARMAEEACLRVPAREVGPAPGSPSMAEWCRREGAALAVAEGSRVEDAAADANASPGEVMEWMRERTLPLPFWRTRTAVPAVLARPHTGARERRAAAEAYRRLGPPGPPGKHGPAARTRRAGIAALAREYRVSEATIENWGRRGQ